MHHTLFGTSFIVIKNINFIRNHFRIKLHRHYSPQSPRDDFDIRPNYDDLDDDFDSGGSGRDRERQRDRDGDRDNDYDDRRDDGPADDPSGGCGSGDLTYEKVFIYIIVQFLRIEN